MSTSWFVWNDDGTVDCMAMEQYIEETKKNPKFGKRKVVKQEYVGDVWVSTIFLNIDHGFGSGFPILWETMVFPQDDDSGRELEQERYCFEQEAIDGHEYMVEKYRAD